MAKWKKNFNSEFLNGLRSTYNSVKCLLLYLDSIDWNFFFFIFTELILKKYVSPKSILSLPVITLNGQLMNF